MTDETGAVSRSSNRHLWDIVDEHLLHYGRDFVREMIVSATGSVLRTETGRSVLDFSSGQMCATLGHNHPAVLSAMQDAAKDVLHLDSTMLAPSVALLAEALAELLPGSLSRMQFLNTGAESNEAAIKMAKLYTGNFEIIALGGSWHGATAGAATSTFAHGRRGYGPTIPGAIAIPSPNCYRCPIKHCRDRCDMTCLEVGLTHADEVSVGSLAALIVEPIQSAGGIVTPPPGYFKRLKEFCEERDMLLIFDEAQTGLGRTGSLFAFEHDGITPDILTLSKTLGAGLPLAAVCTSNEIATACKDRQYSHYTSHTSDPFTAQVGLSVVQTIVAENLAERSNEIGNYLVARLKDLSTKYECIGQIRGRGLLLGLEVVEHRSKRTPGHQRLTRLSQYCFDYGLNINRVGGPHSVWRIAPPLTVTKSEVDHALQIMDDAFSSYIP